MNNFEKEIIKYFGKDQFKKIQSVTIGIAGLGGLGSNCSHNLIRCGFKKLIIVDFDKVELSNLNRQFYFLNQIGKRKVDALKENLLKINPDIKITTYCEKLEKNNLKNIFKGCSIIIEAFDKAEYKSLIVETFLPTDKFIVSASGLAGYGKSDEIKIHRLRKNLAIVGDLKSEASQDLPPLSPRVNIAAAKQADVVLNYILKNI
ncbi:MAG: sulfur carrier protein ThiS adenylyltransferase ThiF [Candidatus Omnitrophica bacterium]|nr:sulfur carrier protein ThiS adenylyltransferase ThiF [Candidatus Omnitrophota bacterium]